MKMTMDLEIRCNRDCKYQQIMKRGVEGLVNNNKSGSLVRTSCTQADENMEFMCRSIANNYKSGARTPFKLVIHF